MWEDQFAVEARDLDTNIKHTEETEQGHARLFSSALGCECDVTSSNSSGPGFSAGISYSLDL